MVVFIAILSRLGLQGSMLSLDHSRRKASAQTAFWAGQVARMPRTPDLQWDEVGLQLHRPACWVGSLGDSHSCQIPP